MGDRAGTVLIVEPDEDVRDRIGSWLEAAGFDVLGCPGPGGPEYTCVGGRTSFCPLQKEADVVVLDLCQVSDLVMEGTPAEELLAFYLWKGNRVVALRPWARPVPPVQGEKLVVLGWPPDREEIVTAVRGEP